MYYEELKDRIDEHTEALLIILETVGIVEQDLKEADIKIDTYQYSFAANPFATIIVHMDYKDQVRSIESNLEALGVQVNYKSGFKYEYIEIEI